MIVMKTFSHHWKYCLCNLDETQGQYIFASNVTNNSIYTFPETFCTSITFKWIAFSFVTTLGLYLSIPLLLYHDWNIVKLLISFMISNLGLQVQKLQYPEFSMYTYNVTICRICMHVLGTVDCAIDCWLHLHYWMLYTYSHEGLVAKEMKHFWVKCMLKIEDPILKTHVLICGATGMKSIDPDIVCHHIIQQNMLNLSCELYVIDWQHTESESITTMSFLGSVIRTH